MGADLGAHNRTGASGFVNCRDKRDSLARFGALDCKRAAFTNTVDEILNLPQVPFKTDCCR